MLSKTRKKLMKEGYTGIMKYLFAGYLELKLFLFMSSYHYALIHNNITTFDVDIRTRKLKIIKIIVFTLPLLSAGGIILHLPLADLSFLVLVFYVFVILLFTTGAVIVLGIIALAINMYIEDLPYGDLIFDPFTRWEIEDLEKKYSATKNYNLEAVVKKLYKRRYAVYDLFNNPKEYKDGDKARESLQRFVEGLCQKAFDLNSETVNRSLIDIICGFYDKADSRKLQDFAVAFAQKEKILDDKLAVILSYFIAVNDVIFKDNFDLENKALRVENQRSLINIFLTKALKDRKIADQLHESIILKDIDGYGALTKRLYLNEYMKVKKEVLLGFFIDFFEYRKHKLSGNFEKKKARLEYYESADAYKKALMDVYFETMPVRAFLKELTACGAAAQSYCMDLLLHFNVYELSLLLKDESQPIEKRIYALFLLSRESSLAPFDFEYETKTKVSSGQMQRFPNNPNIKLISTGKISALDEIFAAQKLIKGKPLFEQEEGKCFKEECKKFLDNYSGNIFEAKNIYFNALETELLLTAATVVEQNNDKINVLYILKQFKYIYYSNGKNEILLYEPGTKITKNALAEYKDNRQYIDLLKNIAGFVAKKYSSKVSS